jgi:hypothetical protein
MEPDWKLMSKVWDVVVQDRCPDTMLANNGPAADNLIAMRLEVVVAAAVWVHDVEKMAMEAVLVVAEARLVRDIKEMAMEETVMEEV